MSSLKGSKNVCLDGSETSRVVANKATASPPISDCAVGVPSGESKTTSCSPNAPMAVKTTPKLSPTISAEGNRPGSRAEMCLGLLLNHVNGSLDGSYDVR